MFQLLSHMMYSLTVWLIVIISTADIAPVFTACCCQVTLHSRWHTVLITSRSSMILPWSSYVETRRTSAIRSRRRSKDSALHPHHGATDPSKSHSHCLR